MPTYQRCCEVNPEVDRLVKGLIATGPDHIDLSEHRIQIITVFASPKVDKYGRPQEEAIKVNGYKALGRARIIPYRDRVLGLADAEILIDRKWWDEAGPLERQSLLDHELTHLTVVKDEYDRPLLDACKRPKLKIRLHDAQFGWFHTIAQRYGMHSVECKQAVFLFDQCGQAYWPDLFNATTSVRDVLRKQREAEQAVEDQRKAQGEFEARAGIESVPADTAPTPTP